MELIAQFSILFLVIVLIASAIKALRQPIIIGYVISGMLFAALMGNELTMLMLFFSELGIMFLLFMMGIEFDLGSLKYLGKDILIATLLQTAILGTIGYTIAYAFGFTPLQSIYSALLMIFSSTLLVAKWIEDKKEAQTLHGKIILGTLIMQDILAIIALTILGTLKESTPAAMMLTPFMGILLVLGAFLFAKYIQNTLLHFAGKYPELLFITALGICFLFSEFAMQLGYSMSIGAFIGGIVLGTSLYKAEIYSRMRSLGIFFTLLFFVGIGFQIDVTLPLSRYVFLAAFIGVTLLLKPIVMYLTLRMRGYDARTCFLVGVNLAQASEFAIIIIAGGISMGLIDQEMAAIAIIAVVISMLVSSYLIKYDTLLYAKISRFLERLDKKVLKKEENIVEKIINAQIVIFGHMEFSKGLFAKIKNMGKEVIVIEHDPEHIVELKRLRVEFVHASIHHPEFFDKTEFENTQIVVSNMIDLQENIRIIQEFKKKEALVIATAKNMEDALALYKEKADYVIYPTYVNHQNLSLILEEASTNIDKLLLKKMEEISIFEEKTTHKNKFFWNIDTYMQKLHQRRSIKQEKTKKKSI